MYELTGRLNNYVVNYFTGKSAVTIELDDDKSMISRMFDELRDTTISLKVAKYRKKRSLDANAYFHLLVNRIAAKLGKSDDEVKRDLVKSYGTLARDDNGDLIGAMLPAGVDVDKFYPYTRNYKTEWRDGREYACYLFYERTRDLDTAQMSHLIEGTVEEAKSLGIEVKTEEEISSLLNSWRN